MTRHIVLDTETTGFDFAADRIVEVGAVELIDLLPSGRTFHVYCNPGIPVPAEATEVHGLTDAFLAQHPPFQQISADFISFVETAPIIAHNAAFDAGFLAAELARCGFGALDNEIIDSLALARRKFAGQPCSLDALCRRFRIDTSRRTKHGALLDAELLAAVYIELVGRQSALELSTAEQERTVASVGPRPRPLPPRITAAEEAAHTAMLLQMPNNLWRDVLAEAA